LASGKVDRRNLPAPRARRAASSAGAAEPMNDAEAAIHAVWAALLAPLSVSIRDDFFLDLGGHSLLAAQMISRLRKDPRFEHVSMLDAYQHPTISGLGRSSLRRASTKRCSFRAASKSRMTNCHAAPRRGCDISSAAPRSSRRCTSCSASFPCSGSALT